MKIECKCGALVTGGADHRPDVAHLVRDVDWEAFHDRGAALHLAHRTAIEQGRELDWLRDELGFRGAAPGPSAEDAAFHVQAKAREGFFELVRQCRACGRLMLSDPDDPTRVLFFAPDGHERRDAFGPKGRGS